ncbi:hypothetical protein [Streptomyces sp. NPDC058625]|uniref:P-type ATPase n=1 Tax=Streptomyces sp. NPDC058625 TaxID=3346564 RepID=UPI00365A7523
MVRHTCRVLRDGERRELPSRQLVPGDVVVLEAGDAVPADCRLVEAHEVSVNNAALTGEKSMPPSSEGPPSAEWPGRRADGLDGVAGPHARQPPDPVLLHGPQHFVRVGAISLPAAPACRSLPVRP